MEFPEVVGALSGGAVKVWVGRCLECNWECRSESYEVLQGRCWAHVQVKGHDLIQVIAEWNEEVEVKKLEV